MAEELEHVNSERLIDKLDAFLGYPEFDPHGDPIPSASGEIKANPAMPLSEVLADTNTVLTGITNRSRPFLQHLDKLGLTLGTPIRVDEVTPFDSSLLVTLQREQADPIEPPGSQEYSG
jgi:DtxR family Mn-dependent transcriptional regulator